MENFDARDQDNCRENEFDILFRYTHRYIKSNNYLIYDSNRQNKVCVSMTIFQ
jgi:hypothetical protein